MTQQTRSNDSMPRKDKKRPSPDAAREHAQERRGQGGTVNLDDDDELRPRGNTTRTGGTWQAEGGDAGELGQSPGAGLSNRNGPSDPDSKSRRGAGPERQPARLLPKSYSTAGGKLTRPQSPLA